MASLSITFTASSETGDIVIELDDDRNNGKSEFLYGEKAYFKVFYDPSLVLYVTSSDGTITSEGNGQEIVEDDYEFISDSEQTVSKPIMSIVDYTWLGNSLGTISKTGLYTFECSDTPDPSNNIGVARVRYASQFARYAVTVGSKPYDTYNVVVSCVGKNE